MGLCNNTNNLVKMPLDILKDGRLFFQFTKLYEAIVIIQWPNQQKFNTAAMGVRFGPFHRLYLRPYLDTDTYDLLIDPKVKFITINFTDDVEIFALAAFKGLHSGPEVEELDHVYLDKHSEYAFLKNSQFMVLGEIVIRDRPIQLNDKDLKLEFQVNFCISVKEIYQSNNPSQPINRGDNLALEAIVYASKIPALMKLEDSDEKINDYITRVREFQQDIRRFSASNRALKVCDSIDVYLKNIL
jgi:hypothetical protein